MKKLKLLLSGLLCAALTLTLAIPPIDAGAITINRHNPETEDTRDTEEDTRDTEDMEESSSLNTEEEEVETEIKDSSSHIETSDIIEPADIVFIIDSTGSMAPYIENVANNVRSFSQYLENKKVQVRMSVVEYKDITYDGVDSTIIHTINNTPWHSTTSELVETLQIVKSGVLGGGDDPETLFDALGYVTDEESLKFRSDAHKFAIVLTDSNYKTQNSFDLTKESLLSKLEKQNINTSVITSTDYFSDYEDIIGSEGIITDINSKTFSDDLIKLADVIFKTIETEVIDETITSVKSIKVTCTGKNTIKVGNSAVLNAVIKPATADDKTVSWVVDDEDIASIDVSSDTMTCTVTGESEGTAKITAVSNDGGFTGSYTITVFEGKSSSSSPIIPEDDPPTLAIEIEKRDISVTPSKKTIAKKKSFTIKAALSKEFKEDKEEEEIDDIWESNVDSITYQSARSSIASVTKRGKVTAKKKGKVVIKTKIALADGTDFTYKTTVYVK